MKKTFKKISNETIRSAIDMVAMVAEAYRSEQSINDETDLMMMRDEMDNFLRLTEKIEFAKSTAQIKKLLMKHYSVANAFSEKDIDNSLMV